MIRRGSIVVPTAPHVVHHPFQVEWSKRVQLSCYVGIIVDSDVVAVDEWMPRKFPERIGMSMAVTTQGMSQRRLWHNRQVMGTKSFPTGTKTGSAKIYCKEGFGRVTSADATPLDEQKGRAVWKESDVLGTGKPNSVYLVLHTIPDATLIKKWCLSWVNESDVETDDIRIAVIKKSEGRGIKDWFLLQLWKSDVQADNVARSHFYEINAIKKDDNSGVRVKFQYDISVDWNTWTANGGAFQWSPHDGVAGSIPRFIPTVSGQPLTPSLSTSPHFDITQSTYFYVEVTRTATWVPSALFTPPGSTCQTPNGNGYTTDRITDVKIIQSSTSIGDPYSPANSTATSFKIPLGYVKVTDGDVEFYEMFTQVKDSDSSQMTIGYGGSYTMDEWQSTGNDNNGCPIWQLTITGGIQPPFTWSAYQRKFPVDVSYETPYMQP